MIQFVSFILITFHLLTQSAFAVQTIDSKSGLLIASCLNKQDKNRIVNYLAKNYPPNKKSRRTPLVIKKWYNF